MNKSCGFPACPGIWPFAPPVLRRFQKVFKLLSALPSLVHCGAETGVSSCFGGGGSGGEGGLQRSLSHVIAVTEPPLDHFVQGQHKSLCLIGCSIVHADVFSVWRTGPLPPIPCMCVCVWQSGQSHFTEEGALSTLVLLYHH